MSLRRILSAAALLLVLASACGQAGGHGAAPPTRDAAARTRPGGPHPSPSFQQQFAFSHPAHPSPPSSAPRSGSSAAASQPRSRSGSKKPSGPLKNQVPVSGSVSPDCVVPGGAVTLTVHTRPGAFVIYQAIYSDGGSGAAPPWGKGYGGNAGGKAGPDGTYTSGWVVSPKAPTGPARVDVTVGWNDEWGFTHPRFAVAGPSGTC